VCVSTRPILRFYFIYLTSSPLVTAAVCSVSRSPGRTSPAPPRPGAFTLMDSRVSPFSHPTIFSFVYYPVSSPFIFLIRLCIRTHSSCLSPPVVHSALASIKRASLRLREDSLTCQPERGGVSLYHPIRLG